MAKVSKSLVDDLATLKAIKGNIAGHKQVFNEYYAASNVKSDGTTASMAGKMFDSAWLSGKYGDLMSSMTGPLFWNSKLTRMKVTNKILATEKANSDNKFIIERGYSKVMCGISNDYKAHIQFRELSSHEGGILASNIAMDGIKLKSFISEMALMLSGGVPGQIDEFSCHYTVNAVSKCDDYTEIFVKNVLTLHQLNACYSLGKVPRITTSKRVDTAFSSNHNNIEFLASRSDLIINADILSDSEFSVLISGMGEFPTIINDTYYDNICIPKTDGIVASASGTARNIAVSPVMRVEDYLKSLQSVANKLNAMHDLIRAIDIVQGMGRFTDCVTAVTECDFIVKIDHPRARGIRTMFDGMSVFKQIKLTPKTNLLASSNVLVCDEIIGQEMFNSIYFNFEEFGVGNTVLYGKSVNDDLLIGLLRDHSKISSGFKNPITSNILKRVNKTVDFDFSHCFKDLLYRSNIIDKSRVKLFLDNSYSHLFGPSGNADSTMDYGKAAKVRGSMSSHDVMNTSESNDLHRWLGTHGLDLNINYYDGGLMAAGNIGVKQMTVALEGKLRLIDGDIRMGMTKIWVENAVSRMTYQTSTVETGIMKRFYVGGNDKGSSFYHEDRKNESDSEGEFEIVVDDIIPDSTEHAHTFEVLGEVSGEGSDKDKAPSIKSLAFSAKTKMYDSKLSDAIGSIRTSKEAPATMSGIRKTNIAAFVADVIAKKEGTNLKKFRIKKNSGGGNNTCAYMSVQDSLRDLGAPVKDVGEILTYMCELRKDSVPSLLTDMEIVDSLRRGGYGAIIVDTSSGDKACVSVSNPPGNKGYAAIIGYGAHYDALTQSMPQSRTDPLNDNIEIDIAASNEMVSDMRMMDLVDAVRNTDNVGPRYLQLAAEIKADSAAVMAMVIDSGVVTDPAQERRIEANMTTIFGIGGRGAYI